MSPDLPWQDSVQVVNQFSFKMSRSGYPASWQEDAVKSAIASYEKMVEDDTKDLRPLFRPNTFKEEERRLGKLKKKKL